MTSFTASLTPELALVDPDLAEAARLLLADPADCLAPRDLVSTPSGYPTVASTARARVARPSKVPRLRARSILIVGAWVAVAGVMSSPLLAFLPPRAAPSVIDSPSVPPQPAAAVDGSLGGVSVNWRTIPGASLYNLVLVRGSHRVDFWSKVPAAVVATGRSSRRASTPLETYAWFVYPGFDNGRGTILYGALAARGSVSVRQGTIRNGKTIARKSRAPAASLAG